MRNISTTLVGATVIAAIGGYLVLFAPAPSVPREAALCSPTLAGPGATGTMPAPRPGEEEPLEEGLTYIEIIDSCGPYFGGACVHLRAGPGTDYPVVMELRNSMVFKVVDTVSAGGETWYKVGLDTVPRFPERLAGDWYVHGAYARVFRDKGPEGPAPRNATSTKRIVIRLSEDALYAYNGDALFMRQPISTGLALTPTPQGNFWVLRKIPDAYMQGPIPEVTDQFYDLPGVPWDLYFTKDGAAIHGAYWHDRFGEKWSHGCVNLAPAEAEKLYRWAELGTPVVVEP